MLAAGRLGLAHHTKDTHTKAYSNVNAAAAAAALYFLGVCYIFSSFYRRFTDVSVYSSVFHSAAVGMQNKVEVFSLNAILPLSLHTK